MIIVMDSNQNPNDTRVNVMLEKLGVDKKNIIDISDHELLNNVQTNQMVLITSLETDWMGYHKKLVESYKEKIGSWIVIVTGINHAAIAHMKWYFDGENVSSQCFDLNEEDPVSLAEKLQAIKPPRKNSILLYSVNPSCGKKTMKEMLEKYYLPDWTIEIAEEDSDNLVEDVLLQSDAEVKVVVSDKFEMLHYRKLDTFIHPFFVLTMPDQKVALYLQTRHGNGRECMWANKDLEILAKQVGMTAKGVEKRLFYLSPLYETWRISETNPINDVRFVMWDDFGLPIPRNEYSDTLVHDFLSQFTQTEKLVNAILGKA